VFTKGIDLILSPLMWATLLEQAGKIIDASIYI
jgi:hypothetical protein